MSTLKQLKLPMICEIQI